MATLTLGLSAAITGAIVLWERYSAAQEDAARKAKEQVEIESEARAQMLKTRFEMDSTLSSLKNFSGSREEEKKITDDLNRKYGESFGYYGTAAEWYDVLAQKSGEYTQMLFLQAKAQSMLSKALDADTKLAEAEAQSESDYDTWWGYGGKIDRFFSTDSAYKQNNNGKWKKEEIVSALRKERDEYFKEVENMNLQAAQIGKENYIGGHKKPDKTGLPSGKDKESQKAHEREMTAEEKRAQELWRLREKNIQESISQMEEGSERRMRQAKLDHEKEMAELKVLEEKWRGTQGGGLTDTQEEELNEAYGLADKKYADSMAAIQEERRAAEEQAMREYLKTYGTYEERRLAMAQDYAERIARAETEGEKLSLEKEMQRALDSLDLEGLKNSLDWEAVFGDLDRLSTKGLENLRDRLKEYIATQDGLQPDSLKELVQAVDAINDKVNERDPFGSLYTSMRSLADTTNTLKKVQESYNKALKSGTNEERRNTEATLNSARNARQKSLVEASNALHSSVNKMKEYVGAAGDLMELVGQIGINPPEWLEGYLEGTGQILDGLESIDLTKPMSVVTGGIKAIGGAVKQIMSLGGLIDWNGSNEKEVRDTIDRLTERNEMLQTAIEDLTDEMEHARGAEAIRISRDAVGLQKETNANYLAMAQAQAGYHGSHHSWNYYWEGFTQEQTERVSSQIGRQWDGDLWGLTPEEMKVLRSNVDLWEQIKESGKGGYGDSLAERLDEYIEQAGKLEELTSTLYENLTTTTKADVFDDFLGHLYDLADGADDVYGKIEDGWQDMVNRMAVNNLVGAGFQKQLESWYEDLARLNESRTNGGLTDEEYRLRLEELQKQYEGYVKSAQQDLESLREAGIIKETGGASGSTGQSAKAGGFMAMTQDQGTKLEGMFTAGLRHWSSMDERMESVSEKMSAAENHLARIEANTGKSAGHLEVIAENVVKIIRDGLKVK